MPRSKEKQEPLFDDPPFAGEEDLASENAELRDLLRETSGRMSDGPKVVTPPAVMALIMASLIALRLLAYVVIEHCGRTSEYEAIVSTFLMIGMWGWCFFRWLEQEWASIGAISILKAVLLLTMLYVFLDQLTDGACWRGQLTFGHNGVPGGVAFIVAHLIVASSVIEKGLARIVKVLR